MIQQHKTRNELLLVISTGCTGANVKCPQILARWYYIMCILIAKFYLMISLLKSLSFLQEHVNRCTFLLEMLIEYVIPIIPINVRTRLLVAHWRGHASCACIWNKLLSFLISNLNDRNNRSRYTRKTRAFDDKTNFITFFWCTI